MPSNVKAHFMKYNAPVLQNQTTDGWGIDIEVEEQFKENKYDKASDSRVSNTELNQLFIQ